MYWPRAGHFRAASLLLLLQMSFKYLPQNRCFLGGKAVTAMPAGRGGKECGEGSCPLCQKSPVPVYWKPHRTCPWDGHTLAEVAAVAGAAFCWWQILKAVLREGCGFNSLFSQTRSNCLHRSCADGSCHLIPARMHCFCSYHGWRTKLAKPLQTEGLEEQPEELLRRRHSHKIGNQKASAICCGDPPYGLP